MSTTVKVKMQNVRNFPYNTCGASRHAQTIAEHLSQSKTYPLLSEDAEYCGTSIATTVLHLWSARNLLLELGYTWTVDENQQPVWIKKENT